MYQSKNKFSILIFNKSHFFRNIFQQISLFIHIFDILLCFDPFLSFQTATQTKLKFPIRI